MRRETADVRTAIAARDAATRRVRVSTGIVLAAAAALTAGFTALAAASTHAKKVVRRLDTRQPATRQLPSVVAPAPPLVQLGGSSPTPPPSPAPAPSSAPTPATAPPVVVSGGS